MHQMVYLIAANADIVAGEIGGRAGMVRYDQDLVADLEIGVTVNMQLAYLFGEAVNGKLG